MEYFDSQGRLLNIDLNKNGELVLFNKSVKGKIPENKVFYREGEEVKTLPAHMIGHAKLDVTNTRVLKQCKSCGHDIQIIVGQGESFYYICAECDAVKEKKQ